MNDRPGRLRRLAQGAETRIRLLHRRFEAGHGVAVEAQTVGVNPAGADAGRVHLLESPRRPPRRG